VITTTKIILAFCVCALSCLSASARAALVDDFDGPARDPAWHEEDIKNSSALIYTAPLKGIFEVTGVKQADPRVRGSVQRRMTRAVAPIKGDFTATMDLTWNQQGVAAMFAVKLALLSADGELLAQAGLRDGWIAYRAKTVCAIGSKNPVLGNRVPDKASGEFRIERTGDIYTIKLKGMVLTTGKGSVKDVAQVQVIYTYHDYGPYKQYPKSHFGVIGVDKIMLTPGVVASRKAFAPAKPWTLGKPIVTYWAGPMPMTDAVAKQMAEGGWNLAWVTRRGATEGVGVVEHFRTQLDVLQRHGLR